MAHHGAGERIIHRLRALLVTGALVLTGVAGADPSVAYLKAALELYDGAQTAVTVLGDPSVDTTASVTLVDPAGTSDAAKTVSVPLTTGDPIKIPAGQTVVIPITIAVGTQPANWRHVYAQLITTLTVPAKDAVPAKDGAPAAAAIPARALQSAVPITVHAKNTLMTDPRITFWIGPALALLAVLVGMGFGRIKRGNRLLAGKAELGNSWLTNLTFIGALGTGFLSQVTVDGANKTLVLVMLAAVVALLALGPLVYRSLIDENDTAPWWAYVGAAFITLTAALSALVILYRIAPAATDTIQTLGLNYAVSSVGQQVLRALACVIAAGVTVVGTLSIINALRSAAPLNDLERERAAPAHPSMRRQPPPL